MQDGTWLTPLPLDRDAALAAVSSRWVLGEGAAAIHLSVPAMSFARYDRFTKVAMTIRMVLGIDTEISLYRMADRLPEEDGHRELVKHALDRWRSEYGRLPATLTDILMDVSEPEDPQAAWYVLLLWAASHGVHWRSPLEPEAEPFQIRRALSYYAAHTMTVESCVDVLTLAAEAQYAVKKKVLKAPPETPEQEEAREEREQSLRYSRSLEQIRSGAVRPGQSTKSPSAG